MCLIYKDILVYIMFIMRHNNIIRHNMGIVGGVRRLGRAIYNVVLLNVYHCFLLQDYIMSCIVSLHSAIYGTNKNV